MPQTKSAGPTLSDTTAVGRQAVKFIVIGLVVLIVGRTLLTAAINYYKAVNPPAPPPPTMGFGPLPSIQFPPQADEDKPKGYTLEYPGRLPTFGDRAKVFFMPKPSLSLLSDERVRAIANQYQFKTQPEVLGNERYRWTKSQPLESTLEIDAKTLNLRLETNFLSKPELLSRKRPMEENQAASRLKSFLSSTNLLPPDSATSTAQITYLKALGSDLQPAASLSDADFLQVDLSRYPIDGKYNFFSPEGTKAIAYGIISSALTGNDSVVRLHLNYFPINYQQVETYPLRSTESAWRLLQGGEGYIVNPGVTETAVVRNVTLGYYEAFEEQSYFQPIYVFTGDDGFMGYVPAIDPQARIR